MNEIQLNLTLVEVNLILQALGEMPYAKVYQVIGKIQQQAEAQLQENHRGMENKQTPTESSQ